MIEELKKAESKRGANFKDVKLGDKENFRKRKNTSKFSNTSQVPDLTGGEILEDDSDHESESESQNLRKRRPIRKHKQEISKTRTSKTETKRRPREKTILRNLAAKTTSIESALEATLLSILELPQNVDSHLGSVLESLTDVESMMDIYENVLTQDLLFGSKIGKFMIVIRRLVVETYPNHPKSQEINEKTLNMMKRVGEILTFRVLLI